MRKPRWSLRTWLIAPTAALVTILSATGALLQTDTLVRAWLGSTRQLSELASRQVTEYILLRLEEPDQEPAGQALEGAPRRKALLTRIDNDPKLAGLLESSGAGANSIAEISVLDHAGVVLASSNRSRPGNPAARVAPLTSLEALDALSRVRAVWAPGREYEMRVPVGLVGDTKPLFIVQVLVSNALLRETLMPGIRRIVGTASLAYLVALLLVGMVAEVTRRNLRRIGERIDRIGGAGSVPSQRQAPASATTEFDAVESKLTLMEGRVRGALDEAQDYKQRVGALLKGLEEAILLLDGDRVALAAGAVEGLFGWSSEQASGKEIQQLFEANSSLLRLVVASRKSGRPIHNAEIAFGPGGSRRFTLNIDYIADSADPMRTLTLLRVRDAEGATHVESQLQVVSRLEAINRLTGGVAHEIKNPLNAIAARLALLESIVEGDSEAEGEIRVVADEIQRLDRVVRTFLDFTQPLDLQRYPVNLCEMARNVVDVVRPDAAQRGVSLQFFEDSGPLRALGDRDLLQQALMNIVVNAVEATPAGGEVNVIASESHNQGRLRITDNGPGIPENVRSRIFQLYFTTKTGGSGIGLAVAYRSLQLHGGDIHVETQTGKGTTFDLMIPLAQAEAVAIA